MELSKEKKYKVNGRIGQYELTSPIGEAQCFFMDDTDEYEYFDDPIIEELKEE